MNGAYIQHSQDTQEFQVGFTAPVGSANPFLYGKEWLDWKLGYESKNTVYDAIENQMVWEYVAQQFNESVGIL